MKKGEYLKTPQATSEWWITMIVVNIHMFYAINEMSIVLNPSRPDDGGGIEEPVRKNHQFKVDALCSTTM